ncbi:hypothetical protein [Plastoroseomonas arctica]|uniref:Uncharacterized protein n=1 Tax=Plastoroseomonas arctica TaxID=1509237 RepID=A0AAF1K5T3_9PROT|nr:hypothetical protein [Plastoroseomonas arctica]MBR0657123.1 hypothetical protein [Plastoroseomonas arctica]
MAIRMSRASRVDSGFAALMTYLAARAPFATLPLGEVAETVGGAIRRNHYVLAVEDGRVVGGVCWALCDHAVATEWLNGGRTPGFADVLDGDTVVLMLGGADHARATVCGIRHVATLYPGRRYILNRFGRTGRHPTGRFPASRPGVPSTAG